MLCNQKEVEHPMWKKILTITLLLTLIMAMSLSGTTSVLAETTNDSLANALDKQGDIEVQLDGLAAQQAELNSRKDELSGELAWLNSRSEEQRALYQEKTDQLQAALEEMNQAITDYTQAEADLAQRKDDYLQRLQVMYDHQNVSVFEMFLKSDSIQSFFTTWQLMRIISDTDEQMLDELEVAKDNMELKKQVAEQQTQDMEAVVVTLQAELDQIEADAAAKADDLNTLDLAISQQEQAEDALNAESEAISQEIYVLQQKVAAEKAAAATKAAQVTAAAQATAAAKDAAAAAAQAATAQAAAAAQAATGSPVGNSANSQGWVWPYPGDHTIYSPYGNRLHPIYHYYKFHSGVDLGGKFGNPIVAARAGTVILVRTPVAGQNTGGSGYGNYVVIAHGDEFTSLYGHMKDVLVSVGQEVQAGEKIGTCGSTGVSTGAHLHFEIRIDGKTTDPAPYIK